MTKFVEFFITLAVVALAGCARTQDVDLGTTTPIDAGATTVDAAASDAGLETDATTADSDPDTDEQVDESMRHGTKGRHDRGVTPQSTTPSDEPDPS